MLKKKERKFLGCHDDKRLDRTLEGLTVNKFSSLPTGFSMTWIFRSMPARVNHSVFSFNEGT